jgi:hypothetical protein
MADGMLDGLELVKLAKELDAATEEVKLGAHRVVEEHAEDLGRRWRANARRSAGKHGVHYPRAITASPTGQAVGAVEWEVGPESAMPQGGMGAGFEYGGPYQPPHLDGARAIQKVEPRFVKSVEELLKDFLA